MRDGVIAQKIAFLLIVMPVPDQVRDDGSGIQQCSALKEFWITGQARNDDTELFVAFQNCDTVYDGRGPVRVITLTPPASPGSASGGRPACHARHERAGGGLAKPSPIKGEGFLQN
ncbi:MAG: hypothetical protein JRH12_19095 [Deltaproteobacteria bacterium]|nr:hypothetical protein [Deltaproteobacteria bacterium]